MNLTNVIINYRRYLKRRNYSHHTLKTYLNNLSLAAIISNSAYR
jgi:hypothetical protein